MVDPYRRYRHLFELIDRYWNRSGEDTHFLYHYTQPKVVEALLANGGDIGCVRVDTLADTTEFKFGFDLFLDYLARQGWGQRYTEAMRDVYDASEYLPWTASFCYEADSAHLWKNYCPDGGMALGFSRNELFEAVNRVCETSPGPGYADCHTTLFLPCFYQGVHDLDALFRAAVSDNIKEIARFRQNPCPDIRTASNVTAIAVVIASIVKHYDYREEHEFRIVKFPSLFGCEMEPINASGKMMVKSGIGKVTPGGFRSLVRLLAVGPYGNTNELYAKACIIADEHQLPFVPCLSSEEPSVKRRRIQRELAQSGIVTI